jgi:hypothetical protein
MKHILRITIIVLCCTVLGFGGKSAMAKKFADTDREKMLELIATMKRPGAFVPHTSGNGGRWEDWYSKASKLLENIIAQSDLDDEMVKQLVDIIVTLEHDSFLGREIVGKMRGHNELLMLVDNLSEHMLAKHAVITLNAALSLLRECKEPETPRVLLKYLNKRLKYIKENKKPGVSYTLLDGSFTILENHFPTQPELIEFLWEQFPNIAVNSSLKKRTEKLLGAYSAKGNKKWLLQALASKDRYTRGMAIRFALTYKEKDVKEALLDSLRQIVVEGLEYDGSIGKPKKIIAELAAKDDRALQVLLDLVVGKEDYDACNFVRRILNDKPDLFNRVQWKYLLENMKKKPNNARLMEMVGEADMRLVVNEVMALLIKIDSNSENYLVKGIVAQKSRTLLRFIKALEKADEKTKLSLLYQLRRVKLNEKCQKGLLVYLKDTNKNVVQTTFATLYTSQEPDVIKELKKVDISKFEKEQFEYLTLRNSMHLDWTVASKSVKTGDACHATLVIKNMGYFPISVPPSTFTYHNANWFLVWEDSYLGPIRLLGSGGASRKNPRHLRQAGKIVNRNEQAELDIDIGEFLSILGPGAHKLRLVYHSRSQQRHWPQYPDFVVKTPELEFVVKASEGWEKSQQSALAAINHPTQEEREAGWKRIKIESASPQKESEWYPILTGLSQGKLSDNSCVFVLKQYDQEIHSVDYTIKVNKGKVRFEYRWDEEDIGGGGNLNISEKDAKAFFQDMLKGSPFSFKPLQKYGSAYESKLTVDLQVKKNNDPNSKGGSIFSLFDYGATIASSPALWTFELSHNPQTAPWFNKIMEWKKRSNERE